MTIEEAITTAIEFEKKVHAAYAGAAAKATDPTARKVFEVMAREETGHVEYLESRLAEWRREGRLSPVALKTVLPSRERIAAGVKQLRARVTGRPPAAESPELGYLQQALATEHETSAFYERMVAELPSEGRELFARFLEIEQGHAAIVQAEIDSVAGNGFWFDMMEFSLEAE